MSATTPGSDGRHALIVATASYADPKLRRLRAPAADAERLADVLRDPDRGDFDVEVVLDETYATVTRRIARFFHDRRANDLLLLHFSCHGVKDDRGELYLAATDTEIDLVSATGVSAAWLNDQITRTRARRTVLLLDCCFSGSFPFGVRAKAIGAVDAPQQFQGRGRVVITASSAMEYAFEGDQVDGEGQPSVFTEAIVEGLATGEADVDHDQLISVDDLYAYVYDRVKERTPAQTPNKKSEIQGPLYLARSVYRPQVKPAALDPELLARTEDRYAGIRAGAVEELAGLLRSHDPAIGLAARQALTRMVDDDSRRVSASAQAALDAAQPAEDERVDEPPVPAGSRRRVWVAIAAATAVLLAAGAILLTRGGNPPPTSDLQRLLDELPSSLRSRCHQTPAGHSDSWMVGPGAARVQVECELAHSPSYLAFGLWPSPADAHRWVSTARDPGAQRCADRTTAAMRRTLPRAATDCEDRPSATSQNDKGIAMWWNEDGSPVGGWYGTTSRDQQQALAEWRHVVTAD